LDLFSGIGGFHRGFEEASWEFDWVGFSEIDKYAKETYSKHFPQAVDLGDVRTINIDSIPNEITVCTFGFPCQDLSIAGKRRGLEASRSSLFFDAMQVIRAKRPKYIIFENVKGLFSSNEGRDFAVILNEIANAGYDGQWQLLNTRWFLPQNRERIYFVGHIRGECRPKVFPVERTNRKDKSVFIDESQWRREEKLRIYDGVCSALNTAQGGGHTPLTTKPKIRRLTPTECERLQGFPDGWTEEQSDAQRYKQMGNAVSIPVVKMIAERLLKKETKNAKQ
jgi:DNA (cytosine-5)-methyltransferase 1